MTIENCYQKLGGNYREVCARIPGEALVKRFMGAFLSDPSFQELTSAMAAGDRPTAFRAAHTLKGVCANLGFETLRTSASALTEVLRPAADTIPAAAAPLLEQVRTDHQTTVSAIAEFLGAE